MTAGLEHIGRLVTLGARRTPDAPALRMRGGVTRTYSELETRTNRLANGLLGTGLRPGDRLAAWMEDSVEYGEVILAAAKAGIVLVPVNALLTGREADHILVDSDVRGLVFSGGLADRVEALNGARRCPVILTTGPSPVLGAGDLEEVLARGADRAPTPPGDDDVLLIAYTSGTTGTPKGAMLSHRSVKHIARINAMGYGLPMHGHAAFTSSMSFVATVTSFVVSHLLVGGCTTVMGKWDLDTLLDFVEAERCTFIYLPTPLLAGFAEAAARRPAAWRTLRTVLHAASKADPKDLAALADVIGERLVEGWGMTENSGGLVTVTGPADMRGEHQAMELFASVGRPAADCAVRLVDGNGEEAAHDGTAVGELVVQSPALMAGYWRNPTATSAVLQDSWYHTGDLGSIDPAGYVYVSDRRSDLIVSGGLNVYPSEVELAISEHPDVVECAVVGVAHPRWGQTVAAAVVVREGASLTEDDIVTFTRKRVASYKKPTTVRFVDTLPRTASNKVMRRLLKERIEADAARGSADA